MSPRRSLVIRRSAWIGPRRAALTIVAALAAVTLMPSASQADTSHSLTVVGTSDVFDSDLVQNVIKPGFEAAYPQYTLNYVSQGTGAAIAYAEAGTASALLVHAASLENQFVAAGYSDEQYGRAIFYGDYVLLGPDSDPAGVKTNAPHDIVTAFQDIASEGATNSDVNFVSRGGTPGTTVEEHAIWGLTTGVTTCTVSGANGGGNTPSTTSGACPQTAPAWYHTTGLTQGPNVVNADSCSYTGGNCYVLTDRGTYQFLKSEGAISNLEVVSNNNLASAVGGENLLINSFHAYAINPASFSGNPNVHINLAGATALLNWLTSPAGQAAVTAYQSSDPGGSSFIGDAAPALTGSLPKKVTAGQPLTVTGSLKNTVPGTPPLAGVGITLKAVNAGTSSAVAVANTTTDSAGNYTMTYTPTVNATYTVSSDAISQIEDSTLSPVFGDLLQPTSTSLGGSKVAGAATIKTVTAKKGVVTIKGTVSPAASGSGAHLSVYGNHHARVAHQGLPFVKQFALVAGQHSFRISLKLHRGFTWDVSVHYVNSGKVITGVSPTHSVHVT